MQYFILTVLSIISLMMLAVIGRELYHTQPKVDTNLRRLEEMIAVEILILTSIVVVIKLG